MAYKVFQNGYPLPASELNNYLMNQTVMVFATASARAADIPSPTEGMVTYREDANVLEVYNGSAWTDINDNTAAIPKSIIDAAGDLIVGSAADTPTRLAVGTSGQLLTSDGTTVSWQNPPSSSGYSNFVTFTSSGSWTVPSGVSKCAVWVIGGGGGGRGGNANKQPSATAVIGGRGGHGAGLSHEYLYSVTPGASVTVTVGAGGTGGAGGAGASGSASGSSGSNGSSSSFGWLTSNYGQSGSSNPPDITSESFQLGGGIARYGIAAFNTTSNTNGNNGATPSGIAVPTLTNQTAGTGSNGANGQAGTVLGNGGTGASGFFGAGGQGASAGDGTTAWTGGNGLSGGGGGGGVAQSTSAITTTAGNGGNGAANSGAGGGGGGAVMRVTSTGNSTIGTGGTGGNGGSGFVIIAY